MLGKVRNRLRASAPQDLVAAPRFNLDMPLMSAVLLLLAAGLVLVGSASMDVACAVYGDPFRLVMKQLVFIAVGLVVMGVVMKVPVNIIRQYSWVGLLMGYFLLIAVLVVGREINGSVRWISLGFFNLQASEVAKLSVVIYMAGYLVRHLKEVRTRWSGFMKPLAVMFGLAFLLLAEPDLGALVVLTIAVMGMIFMAGARFHQFLVVIVGLAGLIFLLIWIEPYRMARMASFMDPWADAFGSGYQLTQALIAFGRGGWFGEGLGNSIQKLFYLPEAHTDFVFAVLAEEFGAIGSLLLLAVFLFVSWRTLQLGSRAESKGLLFHGFLAYGIALLFFSQVFINVGVNTGLLPTKGLTLPLISYGGSSIIVNCMAFGVLFRIDYERRMMDKVGKRSAGRRRYQQENKLDTAQQNEQASGASDGEHVYG